MKKLLLMLLGLALAAKAQDVNGVMNAHELATTNTVVVLTVGASQGDGTVCKLTKIPSPAISFTLGCTSGDGKTSVTGNQIIRVPVGAGVQALPWGFGDVLCEIVVNPTAAAVAAGSVGSVAANSVGWSCSTNIRTAGAITGQTAPSSGVVTWP